MPSPAGGLAGYLRGVSALSPTDVWAVGSKGSRSLALHWNGKRWTLIPSPNPGPAAGRADALYAVYGDSGTDVWAVGLSSYQRANGAENRRTLVLHWNGRRWDSVASPNLAPLQHGNQWLAVAGAGSAAAWAVGYHGTGRGQSPLAERWNGHTWSLAPTPAWPGSTCCANALKAVAADRSDDAWAAGDFSNVHMAFVPFVDHWNGTSWRRVPLASRIRDGFVTGIAAVSPNDVWVVANHPPA